MSCTQKYQFTAFTEADFLANGQNGCNFGVGDSFTMAGAATTTLSVFDNDPYLSGGDDYWGAYDFFGQTAQVDGANQGCQMYAEKYYTLKGSDGKVYYLAEITIEGYDAPGAGENFYSFYGNVPPAGVTLSVQCETSVNGCGLDMRCLGSGNTSYVNEAPVFTNVPENNCICVDENTQLVIDLDASSKTVADGDMPTFSISGGADASLFNIDPTTGKLSFKEGPDYETPKSADGDNNYQVTVSVANGDGASTSKTLDICVRDVPETGWVTGRLTIDADGNDNEWNSQTHSWDEGISCQTVQLLDLNGNVVATTTTNSCGEYMFDVPAGSYQVKFPKIDGHEFSKQNTNVAEHMDSDADANGLTDVITVTAGSTECNVDAGLKPLLTGCVTGRLSLDADGNNNEWNSQDWGWDAGIEDQTVQLIDLNGNVVATTTTDGCGEYSFEAPAGQYRVKFPKLDGHEFSEQNTNVPEYMDSDADATGLTDVITIPGNGTVCNVDAGLKPLPTGCVTGRLTFDADGNDSEWNSQTNDWDEGISCETIQLVDLNGKVVATTVTDGFGNYSFEAPAGQYRVQFPKIDGHEFSKQNANVPEHMDSDADANGLTDVITIPGNGTVCDVDAGVKPIADAVIKGQVFFDENHSGGREVTDQPAGNVTVELLDCSGNVVATTKTNPDGSYIFDGLEPGTYAVRFPQEVDGRKLIEQDQRDNGVTETNDSDADPNTGLSDPITLEASETEQVDAGLADPGKSAIKGQAFFDEDGSGTQSAGDQPAANIQVQLLNASGQVIATVNTGADGSYMFGNLQGGTYQVRFPTKAGDRDLIAQDQGSNDQIDSDANPTTGTTAPITLGVAQVISDVDAGFAGNSAPTAVDDTGQTCANKALTVDALANDSDANGDVLTITQVGGQSISEGGSITYNGIKVSLSGGKLVIDGAEKFADLAQGNSTTVKIPYTISDGSAEASANVDATFLGAKATLDSLEKTLPDGPVQFQVVDYYPQPGAFAIRLTGTGNAKIDGIKIEAAYCVSYDAKVLTGDTLAQAPVLEGTITVADKAFVDQSELQTVGQNGETALENLDLISWILNQDFNSDSYRDAGFTSGVTEAEIQGAIWGLTDNKVYINNSQGTLGQTADAQKIIDLAISNGEGFEAGPGGKVALYIDPTSSAESSGHFQPYVVAVNYDDLNPGC